MNDKPRLLRITTVPISLKILLRGQLAFFQETGFDVMAISSPGPEVSAVREEGITVETIPMTRTIAPLKDLRSLLRLISAIRRFKPDIVHTHTPKAGLLGMLAAWWCRVPVRIHTVAGLVWMEETGWKKKLLMLTEKITYACATAIYPNSYGLKTFIEENIRTRTPLRVIGSGSTNGINIRAFSASPAIEQQAAALRRQYGAGPETTLFVFVGRIVRDKGIDELVSAFDAVSKLIPCRLILAGPFEDDLDPIAPESRRLIEENKHILAPGYVDDVRPLLRAGDVFVFPSYREGFPNVVLQACCMGCPCIVSNINGCNEIITHEENGLVVSPKSAGELKEAMMSLAEDPQKRRAFAGRARDLVVARYDQERIWQALLNEYRTLLGAGK